MVSEGGHRRYLRRSLAIASAQHKICRVFQSDAFGGQSLFGYKSSVTLKTRELFSLYNPSLHNFTLRVVFVLQTLSVSGTFTP